MKDSRGHITESGLGYAGNMEGQRSLSRGVLVFDIVTPGGAREVNEEKTENTPARRRPPSEAPQSPAWDSQSTQRHGEFLHHTTDCSSPSN